MRNVIYKERTQKLIRTHYLLLHRCTMFIADVRRPCAAHCGDTPVIASATKGCLVMLVWARARQRCPRCTARNLWRPACSFCSTCVPAIALSRHRPLPHAQTIKNKKYNPARTRPPASRERTTSTSMKHVNMHLGFPARACTQP